jgi:hypothetical protein
VSTKYNNEVALLLGCASHSAVMGAWSIIGTDRVTDQVGGALKVLLVKVY